MTLYRNIFLLLFLAFNALTLNAQECKSIDTSIADKQRAIIPGNSMGQKLESLLFWSQEEKKQRFPIMHAIFPSIQVEKGSHISLMEKGEAIIPQWEEDATNLVSYIKDNQIAGVIVLQNNKIRLEAYGEGVAQESLWTSFSMAKSVTSMLLGIALEEGAIESLEDELQKYIPELEGYDYGKVSVYQLLTMTSGIAWNEDYEDTNSDVAQMYQNPCSDQESHILTYMKALEFAHQPGEHWNYSTGETDLIGILLQRATKTSLAAYLSEKIWKPIGMEHCAYWLADECSNENIGGSGLSASLRDYARLGSLMLNRGIYANSSILSEEWIETSTSLLFETDGQGGGYGHSWWRFKDGSYAAVGIFGQMLYINPDKNLIVAQVAAWPKASSKDLTKARQDFLQAVQRALD